MSMIFKEVNSDFSELQYTSSVSASTWPSDQYWVIFELSKESITASLIKKFLMA
jgi:hypothetical protein